MKKTLLMAMPLLWLCSCYYDSVERLYPGSANCSGNITVTFQTNVLPVMERSCNSATCHNSADRAANVTLDTYDGVKAAANNGTLIGSMRHDAGFAPMPVGQAKMDNCTLLQIEQWIADGTPNN